ncbi:MAG: hypothetical protein M1587_06770 [Thaumarchaeota archaeon]|nr:hypothetical protein [Nitrososphaerota archaeon]
MLAFTLVALVLPGYCKNGSKHHFVPVKLGPEDDDICEDCRRSEAKERKRIARIGENEDFENSVGREITVGDEFTYQETKRLECDKCGTRLFYPARRTAVAWITIEKSEIPRWEHIGAKCTNPKCDRVYTEGELGLLFTNLNTEPHYV